MSGKYAGQAVPAFEEIRSLLEKAVDKIAELIGTDENARIRTKWTDHQTWGDSHGFGFPDQVQRPNSSLTLQEEWDRVSVLDSVKALRKAMKPYESKLLPYLA